MVLFQMNGSIMGCGKMLSVESLRDVQSLRISGLLCLLNSHTGYKVFNESDLSINVSELITVVKKNKIPEDIKNRLYYYFQKNQKEKLCYHEGVFYKLSKDLLEQIIDEQSFLYEINKLLLNEIDYLNTIKAKVMNFPDFKDVKMSKDFKKLKKDKKIKDSFLIAPKPKGMFLKRKKPILRLENDRIVKAGKFDAPKKSLYLKEKELYGFNLMNGATGSGVRLAALSLFVQNLFKGNGGIYLSLNYHYDEFTIYSVAKSLKREDDLLLVNASNFNQLFSFKLDDIIKNNKIIVFKSNLNISSLTKIEDFIDQFIQFLFINIQSDVSVDKGFMFMFGEMLSFIQPFKERMNILNDFFKKKKMTGVFFESEEILVGENDFDFIKMMMRNYFVFRQETNINKFLSNDIKELAKNFNVGEFIYLKNLKNNNVKNEDLEKYCFCFHDYYNNGNESVYETMF